METKLGLSIYLSILSIYWCRYEQITNINIAEIPQYPWLELSSSCWCGAWNQAELAYTKPWPGWVKNAGIIEIKTQTQHSLTASSWTSTPPPPPAPRWTARTSSPTSASPRSEDGERQERQREGAGTNVPPLEAGVRHRQEEQREDHQQGLGAGR